MNPILTTYLATLNRRYARGDASEHTYRKDLEDLLIALLPDIEVTNEPSQVTDCGNPDFLLSKQSIPVGFIEAKDIGKDLNHKQYNEQITRYRNDRENPPFRKEKISPLKTCSTISTLYYTAPTTAKNTPNF